jgi:hypothetical protein
MKAVCVGPVSRIRLPSGRIRALSSVDMPTQCLPDSVEVVRAFLFAAMAAHGHTRDSPTELAHLSAVLMQGADRFV